MAILLSSVYGGIHSAAGWSLWEECEKLNGCKPDDAKITSGHRLLAKHNLRMCMHTLLYVCVSVCVCIRI